MIEVDSIVKAAIELTKISAFDIKKFLFKEQLDFINDPAKYSTAVCSVRAGKSTACAADLINTALTMPGTIGLYITLARSSAKRIIWPELHKFNREHNLGMIPNEQDLSMKFPNGSIIYCSGANTEVEIEKFRGLSNVALAYIDEAQAFRKHIKELVEEILVKRLYDTNGRCRLIGTPGPIPAGYFYECSQSPQWSHHAWTLHQNPHIERKSGLTVAQLIQQDMARKGVDINDPSIQRECFGRWVLDANSLLLEYVAEKNHFDTLPSGNYSYLLGIDLGFDDSDSLSVLAFTDKSPITYLVYEDVTEKQTIEALVNKIGNIQKTYLVCKMVIDTGGLGKKITESIKARYALPLETADKTGKMANYSLLNNALRTGNFKAKKTSRFAQDCNILEKDKDKSTPDKIVVRGHSDSIDSVLYPFKESPAYGYTPPIQGPIKGSPEWFIKEAEDMRQKNYELIIEQQKQITGEDPFLQGFDMNSYKY